MSDVVVPFRPRNQVTRTSIASFCSDPVEDQSIRMGLSPRLRIDGDVRYLQLLRALRAGGLDLRRDERTESFVIVSAAPS
jgi:hypothetical protein